MSPAFRLSLAANLLLAGAVAVLLWQPPPAPSPVETPAPRPAVQIDPPVTGATFAPVVPRNTDRRVTPATVAQLEQAGIPREVLISALRENSHRRWDQRVKELEQRHAPRPVPAREYAELARRRVDAQERELREALGEEDYRQWDKEQALRTVNTAGIPLNEREEEAAYRLQKSYSQRTQELEWAMEEGVADRADGAVLLAQAQEEFRRGLEDLLGAERRQALQGGSNPVSDVQWRYGAFNPRPDQANAVLQAEADGRVREAALSSRVQGGLTDANAVVTELKTIREAREENLRRIFGAEAYENHQRQGDSTYQALTLYAGTWELREAEIQPVYQTLRAFQEQAELIREAAMLRESAGQPVDWRDTNAAIERSRGEVEAGLQALLGAWRLQRLKQNGLLAAP